MVAALKRITGLGYLGLNSGMAKSINNFAFDITKGNEIKVPKGLLNILEKLLEITQSASGKSMFILPKHYDPSLEIRCFPKGDVTYFVLIKNSSWGGGHGGACDGNEIMVLARNNEGKYEFSEGTIPGLDDRISFYTRYGSLNNLNVDLVKTFPELKDKNYTPKAKEEKLWF